MCDAVTSVDDVRGLVVAAQILSAIGDLQALTSSACKKMKQQTESDLCAIAIYDSQKDTLAVRAAEGLEPSVTSLILPRGPGLGWRSLDQGIPVTTYNDVGGPDRRDQLVDAFASAGADEVAAAPITFGGNWLGVLFAGNRSGRVSPRDTVLISDYGALLAPLIITAGRIERAGLMAVEQERQRIAQLLHDTAGQLLFRITMKAQELQDAGSADRGELVMKTAREIEADASTATNHLRLAMHNLLPAAEALTATARRDAAAFSDRTGVATEVITLGHPQPGPGQTDATLLCVIREALHNVEKHAEATAAIVTVAYGQTDIVLVVEDDGGGLSPTYVCDPIPGRRSGLGIPGLLQMVEQLGGTLELIDDEDGGARLRVVVPAGSMPSESVDDTAGGASQ